MKSLHYDIHDNASFLINLNPNDIYINQSNMDRQIKTL
jgi:hypothetical protein